MTSPERSIFEDEDFQQQLSREVTRMAERQQVVRKSKLLASELWKRLVKNVGEHQAKETMRQIMGDNEPGPPRTHEDNALIDHICAYIHYCGPNLSDEKIAKRIFESKPYYVQFGSGEIVVASKEFQVEADATLAEYPNAVCRPIGKGLVALKRQVGRVRRWAIEEGLLAKEYTPRPYRRD
jgi:hypothetical protein